MADTQFPWNQSLTLEEMHRRLRLDEFFGPQRNHAAPTLVPVTAANGQRLVYYTPPVSATTPAVPQGTPAPAATQPSPGAAAANPNSLPVAGQTTTPPTTTAASAITATPVDQEFAAQLDAAARDSYTPVFYGYFTDPESFIDSNGNITNRLTNLYTLTFYTHWDVVPDKRKGKTSVELPFVSRVTMQAPNAVARTRALNGLVYAEHAGFVQRTFVIEGRSGPVWGLGEDNELAISRFTKLRNFIEVYGKTSTANKNALVRYEDSRLIMLASFESEAHFCDIVSFNYRRSTDTSTYSFEYSITLVTNGMYGRVRYPGKLTSAPNAKAEAALLPEFQSELLVNEYETWTRLTDFEARVRQEEVEFGQSNTLATMSCSGLQELRLGVSTLSAALDTSVFTQDISAESRRTAKASLGWNAYALDVAHRIKGTSGLACPVPPWSDLYYGLVSAGTAGAAVIRFIMDVVRGKAPTQPTYSSDAYVPYRPGLLAPSNTTPEQPYTAINYFLTEGSADAYSVAAAVLGSSNYYWRIISLNNLQDAYTRGDGTPLVPGTSILVPAAGVPAVKDNDVLGTDLLIVNGDLQLVGNNEVMRVSGFACYSQNLMHRMQTPRGSNRVFPGYGLPDDLNSSAASTIPATITMEVRDQLLQDFRTEEVKDLSLTEQGDKVAVSVLVTPIAGTARRFAFNYNLNAEVSP